MEAVTGFIITIVASVVTAAWLGICAGIVVETFKWFTGLFS